MKQPAENMHDGQIWLQPDRPRRKKDAADQSLWQKWAFARPSRTFCGILLTALTLHLAGMFPAVASSGQTVGGGKAIQAGQIKQKIMVYGDSLSAAYGIEAAQGWVSLMEAKLNGRNTVVVNASISGETTTGGANRIKTDLARHQPTIVMLALGANDGLRGLPVADMQRNLGRMLDEIRRANAQAILIGIQIPPNYGITYANDFKQSYVRLASDRKLPLVPFLLDGIADKLENFQPDRLHPTAAAQPRILENVLPVAERVISARQRLASSAAGVDQKTQSSK